MSVGRIATNFLLQQSQGFLQRNQTALSKLQEKTATGQQINRASDDPLGLTSLLDVNRTLNNDEQYKKNVEAARSELETADTALSQMSSLFLRASELATQGATVTTGPDGMKAIAKEVDLLVEQLVQLGNASIEGKYLFSGVKTTTVPFNRSGDIITYAGTPQTQAYQRQVDVDDNAPITINTPGDKLLGTSAGGTFKVLIDLKNNLLAGDTTATRAKLDELKTSIDSLLTVQSDLGATLNQVLLTKNRLEERQDTYSQLYARLQDIDLPKTITDLTAKEQTYQASLSLMGRILPQSLMDFLR
jgi:flagellar hook-associated protein 3 FlgL